MRIKEIRKVKKIKSYEVAAALGVSRSNYSDKENGYRQFKPKEIYKLCQLLEVDFVDIDDFKCAEEKIDEL